jgi:hypothetical protein
MKCYCNGLFLVIIIVLFHLRKYVGLPSSSGSRDRSTSSTSSSSSSIGSNSSGGCSTSSY